MMINDHPTIAVLDVSEAVASRESFAFTVLHKRESIIAGINCRISIHADQVIAERNLQTGKSLEGTHKIVP